MKDKIILAVIVVAGIFAAMLWLMIGRIFGALGFMVPSVCCYLVAAIAMLIVALSIIGGKK